MNENSLKEIEDLQKEAIDEFHEKKDTIEENESIVSENQPIAQNEESIEQVEPEPEPSPEPIQEEGEKEELPFPSKEEESIVTPNFEPIVVKSSNGQEISIDSIDELITFAKKGATVMTPIKQNTEVENFIEQANLTQGDLQLLADAKSGDKQALEVMANQFGVDVLDLVENSDYQPKFQAHQPTELDQAIEAVLANPAQTANFRNMTQFVPEEFINSVTSDVNKFNAFMNHTNSGLAEYAIPLAQKAAMMGRGTFEEAYVYYGSEFVNKQTVSPPLSTKPEKPPERVMSQTEKDLRDRANSGQGNNAEKANSEDIFDMSDDEFAEWKETQRL